MPLKKNLSLLHYFLRRVQCILCHHIFVKLVYVLSSHLPLVLPTDSLPPTHRTYFTSITSVPHFASTLSFLRCTPHYIQKQARITMFLYAVFSNPPLCCLLHKLPASYSQSVIKVSIFTKQVNL